MKLILSIIIMLFAVTEAWAQGYNRSLTFEGIDNIVYHSASARAAGNISVGARNDIGLMFQNPATLLSIGSLQVSLGGVYSSRSSSQKQNYAPVRYYSNLSLLMESRTSLIPDPPHDPNPFAPFGNSVMDTVQRPYDDIGPDWSSSANKNLPVQAMLALPVFSSDEIKIVAGLGAVEYARLDHYYQNNNVLTPSILSQRPLPVFRPTDDNPLEVEWLQQVRSRKGSIQGYGFALAASLSEYNISVGISGMQINGSTDDFEQETGRGNLIFFSNAFRADSLYRHITSTGKSDFSGQEFTVSSEISGEFVSLGFAVKLPATIKRKYSIQTSTDTTGSARLSGVKGEDELQLRWRGVIGLSLTPRQNFRLGIEYDFRPYESVRYADAAGTKSSPWLPASLFRFGIEYMALPWLTLRAGMRGEAEIFEPEGSQIEGEPVTFTVYSAGVGLYYNGLRFNVAYENSLMKYQDVWASAVSKNKERSHVVVADLSYEIPWGF